jgi:hydrophobe/amphiphile efflux-3 (HAE3) family protein
LIYKLRLYSFVITHKVFVFLILLAITVLFGWFAARVEFNNTIETYFFEEDLKDYNRFLDQFGTDEIIAVAFGGEDIFSPENLALIDAISRKLENLAHVRRVLSLTTAKIVYGEGDTVHFDRLIEEVPPPPNEIERIRQRALDDPVIPETLISPDARNTAIVAQIDHIVGEFDYKVELLGQIRKILEEEERQTGKRFHIGGTAVLDDAVFLYTERDQARSFPVMMIVIIVVMFLMFRQVWMSLLPLVVIGIATVWTYGFMVLLGYQINVISTIIGPLILAVGVADSMHIIADYLQKTAQGEPTKVDCIGHSFVDLLTPCFMTSLTTCFGLLSLLVTDLAPLREFGLVAAAGVFFTFIISMLLLPILLYVIPHPPGRRRETIREGAVATLLAWLGQWQRGRAAVIILITFLAAVPAVFSLSHTTIGTNTLDYFRDDDPVRMQTEWIDSNIGGTTSLEFLIDTHAENALKEPSMLRRMECFQHYLEEISGVTGAYSEVDLVKALNRAFNEGDEQKFTIPATYAEVTQQMFIIEGSEDFEELLSYDYSKGRITARIEIGKSQQLAHMMPQIENRMREIFADAATVTPTGVVYLMHNMENYVLTSQIKSFLLAFIIIIISITVLLRSIRLGILAMIPNFLPILFTMALMPLLGISLDIGTVMVAGVALGLVVDDTIHFMSSLKTELQHEPDIRTSVEKAMRRTGRPIIFTSIVLSLGFMVLLFASFNPIIHFGFLSSVVILFALIFDLVVLPAILGFLRPSRRQPE